MRTGSRAPAPPQLQVPKPSDERLSWKNIVLYSPVPSPCIPSLLPRHGKKPPPLNTRKILRYLCWLTVLVTVLYVRRWTRRAPQEGSARLQYDVHGHEMAEDSRLPDYASSIAIAEKDGRSRWTIHIPSNKGFPLTAQEYSDICDHVDDVAGHVAETNGHKRDGAVAKYYDQDPDYLDVAQAQLHDLLPLDPYFTPNGNTPLCKSSLIYVLDNSDAGLGSSLLGLWLAYGLAQFEKRAFFVDDTKFTYGRVSSLFAPMPHPGCRPPPPSHRVPCPRMSQHVVIASGLKDRNFGPAFRDRFTPKDVFGLIRVGYEALFQLLPEDQAYTDLRTLELRSRLATDTLLGGMHIRRGDRHPDAPQYQRGYIPPAEYLDALERSIKVNSTRNTEHTFILASDDADMYHHPDLKDKTVRAQDRLSLASANHLPDTDSKTTLGWERGFFKDTFWNLGLSDHVRSNHQLQHSPLPNLGKDSKWAEQRLLAQKDRGRDYRNHPTEEALQQRVLIGRSYLLDLAVLSRTDRLVCAVSSRGCQILGIMMGWDAVENGRWLNIDRAGTVGWRVDL